MHGRSTVVPLVSDDFLNHGYVVIRDGGDGFELLGSFRKRGLNCRRVALISALHRDGDNRAGLEIDRVLGLVGQMRPAILHLRDSRVGIVWMGPIVIGALLLPFPIDSR
jgi:hypothetical protein